MSKKLIIFGVGELAELAHFYFTHDSNFEVCGFTLNKNLIKANDFKGLPVVEYENICNFFPPSEYQMFIAIGYSNLNKNRKDKYEDAKQKGYTLASYVSSKSTSWPDLVVGENTFIMEDNTIMPFCQIGNNVLIWVNSIIAHHMIIKDHVTITSHCAIGGNVEIEEMAFIGLNSSIRNNIKIGKGSVIGTAANVVKDVEDYTLMIGNPAKPMDVDTRNIKI
jgi:sugar O-acyltransferase (sialic acid O-acetyltransferase NeuD family)